ncbi:hypothetical protein M0R01_00475 [bacterium]|nr:hypothetical protein [bacterium]
MNLQDKRIYVYGGFALALILLVVTLFSFFEKPKYQRSNIDNTQNNPAVANNQNENTSKTYPSPKISFISDTLTKDNYSIKISKVQGMPESVQSVIYNDIEKTKMAFISKYKNASESVKLQNSTPQVYQSGKYVSIVTVFSEYVSGQVVRSKTVSWTYDVEKEKLVSLLEVLESENKNNYTYDYLASSLRVYVVKQIIEKINLSGIDGNERREEIIKNVTDILTAEEKSFSKWYVNEKEIIFIFDPKDFVSFSFDEITVPLDIEGTRLYLKNQEK